MMTYYSSLTEECIVSDGFHLFPKSNGILCHFCISIQLVVPEINVILQFDCIQLVSSEINGIFFLFS